MTNRVGPENGDGNENPSFELDEFRQEITSGNLLNVEKRPSKASRKKVKNQVQILLPAIFDH